MQLVFIVQVIEEILLKPGLNSEQLNGVEQLFGMQLLYKLKQIFEG